LQKQPRKTTSSNSTGFTLVELLVALALAAVLLGMALPAMDNFLDQRARTAQIIDFVMALNYARSEAARSGGPVSIQAVDASDGNNEWGAGYCVVLGNPGNCDPPVLRIFPTVDGATLNAVGDLDGEGTLTFNSRGVLTLGVAGSLELCSTVDGEDPGRQVALSIIGRPNTEELICYP
jgi:prepilin-type N-terminal cleavage/methylation domain-containing protein